QARYASEIEAARSAVMTVEGRTLIAHIHRKEATFDEFVASADQVVVDDAYRRAARVVSPDLARTYADRLADADEDADSIEDALFDARATVAALGMVPEVKDYLESEADKLAERWFAEHRAEIRGLSDERQDVYRSLHEASAEPQDLDLAKPTRWLVPTTALTGESAVDLPAYR